MSHCNCGIHGGDVAGQDVTVSASLGCARLKAGKAAATRNDEDKDGASVEGGKNIFKQQASRGPTHLHQEERFIGRRLELPLPCGQRTSCNILVQLARRVHVRVQRLSEHLAIKCQDAWWDRATSRAASSVASTDGLRSQWPTDWRSGTTGTALHRHPGSRRTSGRS